ncbi:predicted protein [Phaeodactylum tricornutum CCAP 1055/1]|uniref:Brix domain-containing protein n=1 Tax=Phaeodactylum tricornutum (strain CCAP 1055/1) TaxID=556484 RepID=B7G354_PHATC|nr:predicted protein [Phaeodactylum tricornutum CCAP 1055/1]EEC46942.1 predicted protein [Phaeodactylum tricornutum CCAP 1055/1]|eukprot:XP_002181728.1 predicted protein [Phaeodactylum tricornutum CCAP 1055/1]
MAKKKDSFKRRRISGDLVEKAGSLDAGPQQKVDEKVVTEDSSSRRKAELLQAESEVHSDGEDIDDTTVRNDGRYRNKQRCLTLCSRGVTARYRHLLEDLRTLMPHHKKESKLDPGEDGVGQAVSDICEMRSCNTTMFLECRKRQDAYMWLGRVGGQSPGPSVRFHVTNIHTMDELRLTGNCMKGSRPIMTFDESFGRVDHLKLLKELFIDTFGTPRGHPKSKPFVDRVMAFCYADNRIWVRNYQVIEEQPSNAKEAHQIKKNSGREEATSMVEIGPRFVLNPIRIFRGSFGGQTLFQNPDFVSPNEIRSLERKSKGSQYDQRKNSQKERHERKSQLVLPEDPLKSVFR